MLPHKTQPFGSRRINQNQGLGSLKPLIDNLNKEFADLTFYTNKENAINPNISGKSSIVRNNAALPPDSQEKKFKGKTYSEMKRQILATIKPIYHELIVNEQCVVEYADGIHSQMLEQENTRWQPLDYAEKVQKNPKFANARRILLDFLT